MKHLPNYLRMFRKLSGLSQDDVAFLFGLKNSEHISRYERGDRIPALPKVFKFQLLYAASDSQLFAGNFRIAQSEFSGNVDKLIEKYKLVESPSADTQQKLAYLRTVFVRLHSP